MFTVDTRRIREKARRLAFGNLLYNWSLGGAAPDGFAAAIPGPWPGDAARGRWLCGGDLVPEAGALPAFSDGWDAPAGAAPGWLEYRHGFDWLHDLRAAGGDGPRLYARHMVDGWMSHYESWDDFAWRPDIAGRRLMNWIALYDFYGASAGTDFQDRLFDSMARQARHVARTLPGGLEGIPVLAGIRGLAAAGLAFRGRESWLAQALDLLQEQTDKQILADGGHVSRSPAQLAEALRIFADIRAALLAGGYPVPEQIAHSIDRMAQALRFFRHADRTLALFHGAQEGNPALLDALAASAGSQGRILRSLPASGFERLTLGRSTVLMDCGAPPPWPYDGQAHAAPLAFEFSYGRERVFVSCGTHPFDPAWQDALRGTAAHNTLGLDHRNACEIRGDGHFGRRPRKVSASREDSKDALLVDAAHDGYMALNGIVHRRRLYLGAQGHDLRGEETLNCTTRLARPVQAALRFHLHPRVQASPVQGGAEVLLRLPGGSGWRFARSGGGLALENGVYMGDGARPRQTKQIVIYGEMDSDHACIKWALRREGGAV